MEGGAARGGGGRGWAQRAALEAGWWVGPAQVSQGVAAAALGWQTDHLGAQSVMPSPPGPCCSAHISGPPRGTHWQSSEGPHSELSPTPPGATPQPPASNPHKNLSPVDAWVAVSLDRMQGRALAEAHRAPGLPAGPDFNHSACTPELPAGTGHLLLPL